MNQAEIIQGQVNLLVQLNQELASQASPEAAREVRENVKLMLELTGLAEVLGRVAVEADLEERLEVLEEALFGDEEPGEGMERLAEMVTVETILQAIIDCRDDINAIAGAAGD